MEKQSFINDYSNKCWFLALFSTIKIDDKERIGNVFEAVLWFINALRFLEKDACFYKKT